MAIAPLHVATGISIVSLCPNKILGVVLAALSHILLDKYPECRTSFTFIGKDNRINIFGQVVLGFFILSALAFVPTPERWWLLAGGVAALLFDIIEAVNFLWISRKRLFFFHSVEYQRFFMDPIQNLILDSLFVILLILTLF